MTDATLAMIDAFRALWVAAAIKAGIDPQVAIDAHRAYVRELGIVDVEENTATPCDWA